MKGQRFKERQQTMLTVVNLSRSTDLEWSVTKSRGWECIAIVHPLQ